MLVAVYTLPILFRANIYFIWSTGTMREEQCVRDYTSSEQCNVEPTAGQKANGGRG
jgi:hypothetical protein